MATDAFTAMFNFICDKKWQDLHRTGDSTVNYCNGCNKNVYRANSLQELQALAREGRCVSFNTAAFNESERPDDDEGDFGSDSDFLEFMGDIDPNFEQPFIPPPPSNMSGRD